MLANEHDISTSRTFPPVQHSITGESVSICIDPQRKRAWYVFRVTYHKEVQVADTLISQGVYAYVATKIVPKFRNNEVAEKAVALINLVFAYLSLDEAREYVSGNRKIPHLTFYYNHFETAAGSYNPPLTVPEDEMLNFILATRTHNKHLRLLTSDDVRNRIGAEVRVLHGEFSGVHGRLIRLAGQQRVVVRMLDSALIATAYVPTAFLEFVDNP